MRRRRRAPDFYAQDGAAHNAVKMVDNLTKTAVKRDLEDVEERALKRQRKMQDKHTSTEKPKPERKRKTSEPHPNEGKKARQSFSDSDDPFADDSE